MAEGRARQLWHVASHVLALLANCHRNKQERSEPFQPRDFIPPQYLDDTAAKKPAAEPEPEQAFALMKTAFVKSTD